jgi:GAF domain-containing protein
VTDAKNKPGLDEQTFGKLIEAAYVLQEHNREMQLLETSIELQSERLRQQEAESQGSASENPQLPDEPSSKDADYTLTLAKIVEAQNQIQIRRLEKDDAMAMVAERIMRITRASGAGIAILEEKTVHYRAGAGPTALPAGSHTTLTKAICATCLRTGQVLRTQDVNTEFLFDPNLCRSRGILSLVAVPIYHNGEIAGALELYFNKLSGFAEQDIHTCQLMAGLVSEAIGRAAETSLKKSMAAERSSMLAAIETLKPSLTALAADKDAEDKDNDNEEATKSPVEARQPNLPPDSHSDSTTPQLLKPAARSICWKCGEGFIEKEQFCGKCGVPRLEHTGSSQLLPAAGHADLADTRSWLLPAKPASTPAASIASKSDPLSAPPDAFAAAATTERGTGKLPHDLRANDLNSSPFGSKTLALKNTAFPAAASEQESAQSLSLSGRSEDPIATPSSPSSNTVEVGKDDVPWTSAAKARDFLEGVSGKQSTGSFARFWNSHRGDFYLAMAILLVALAVRWAIVSTRSSMNPSSHIAGKSVQSKSPSDSNLSTFDKLLISLGLADPPEEAPEYKGNPDTQVWVDLHTALYYCPGSELYGKTPKGKFASQREAQLDQFEPASRKTCD